MINNYYAILIFITEGGILMSISYNLRAYRLKNKLTQVELGSMLHLSRSAISNYEQGKMEPSIDTIINISEIFKVSTDELLKS